MHINDIGAIIFYKFIFLNFYKSSNLSMKILLGCIVFIVGITQTVFSQNRIDSIDYYIQNYQYDKALEYMKSDDLTKVIGLKRALCFKALDDYSSAVNTLLPLEDKLPDDKQIKAEIALCYQALGNWQQSLARYEKLMDLDSTNVYYQIQHADMLFRLDRINDALANYKLLETEYNLDNMVKRSAQCYERINQLDSAKVYYAKAWGRDSTDSFSAASLINLNIKQGDQHLLNAIDLSEIYLSKDSTNKQINVLNALAYYASDMYEQAVEKFEKCRIDGDSSLLVNRSLGLAYYSLGNRDEAYKYLEKAYEMDSTNLNVLYALGVTYNDKANFVQAAKSFENLIEKRMPANISMYLYYRNLGVAYEGQKKHLLAVNSYVKATKYATDDQRMYLYYTIVSIYDVDLKMSEEALTYYKLYKASLSNYMAKIQTKENLEQKDLIEIDVTKTKLDALDKHILRLQKELIKSDTLQAVVPKMVSSIEINF